MALAPTRAEPVPTEPDYRNRNLILAVMCLALVMVVASVSMLANGMPHIAEALGASQSE